MSFETPAQRPTPGRVSRGDGGGEREQRLRDHLRTEHKYPAEYDLSSEPTETLRVGHDLDHLDLRLALLTPFAGYVPHSHTWEDPLNPPDRVAVESEGGEAFRLSEEFRRLNPTCASADCTGGHTGHWLYPLRENAIKRATSDYARYRAYGIPDANGVSWTFPLHHDYDRVDAAIWADHDIDKCDHDNHPPRDNRWPIDQPFQRSGCVGDDGNLRRGWTRRSDLRLLRDLSEHVGRIWRDAVQRYSRGSNPSRTSPGGDGNRRSPTR